MIRHLPKVVEKARKLRLEKLSFQEISKVIGVPSNSIRNWCSDLRIERHKSLRTNNELRRKIIKNLDNDLAPSLEDITSEKARVFAALLYGCEGSKYPATRTVAFINSDFYLVRSFIWLMRKGFDINEKKFKVHLQIHNNHDFLKIRKFWSSLLHIPESQFFPPTITIPRGKMRRKNYNGTCSLRYGDYKVQLRLLGTFEKFCNYGEVA